MTPTFQFRNENFKLKISFIYPVFYQPQPFKNILFAVYFKNTSYLKKSRNKNFYAGEGANVAVDVFLFSDVEYFECKE